MLKNISFSRLPPASEAPRSALVLSLRPTVQLFPPMSNGDDIPGARAALVRRQRAPTERAASLTQPPLLNPPRRSSFYLYSDGIVTRQSDGSGELPHMSS